MRSEGRLLIVEDDSGVAEQLKWHFDDYHVVLAGDRRTALERLETHRPQVVILDLGLPPDPEGTSEGLATMQDLLAARPETKVIVLTGRGSREVAMKCVEMGAYDFYNKPVDVDELGLIVRRAMHMHALEEENRKLRESALGTQPLDGLVAGSEVMFELSRKVEKLAPSDVTVLVTGESGTGKELVARALHSLSTRREGPFVAINCAAIPDALLESELFGHERGAFTGADRSRAGKIELANGGTLFLDEIGDMPPALQAKLLRFLQEREVERVGSGKPIPVDVRVVCATNRDLSEAIREGTFRQDLYYRISEVCLHLPPLRERGTDVLLIARAFLEQFSRAQKKSVRGFTERAVDAMLEHDWPGNVRELQNRVKSAVVMAEGGKIDAVDLGFEARPETERADEDLDLRRLRDRVEREAVTRALALSNGNVAQAAALLHVTRPTLYNLLKKFSMQPPGRSGDD